MSISNVYFKRSGFHSGIMQSLPILEPEQQPGAKIMSMQSQFPSSSEIRR